MRPLKLTMTAVGPYAGTEELDFTRLGEEGIYLITGETGAGKSTIFDAIFYALYGEPAGKQKKPVMLYSKYAENGVKPCIRLEFLCRGKHYLVERNPPYPHRTKSGKTVETPASASLLRLDDGGESVSGNTKVTNRITELIGLNKQQFPQVAMLAQGTFTELLRGSSDRKEEIFRELFHTQDFQIFQDRVSADANRVKNEWETADELLRNTLKTLAVMPGNPDSTEDPDAALYLLWQDACNWTAVPHMSAVETLLDGMEDLNERDQGRKAVLAEKEARVWMELSECLNKKGQAQSDAENRELLQKQQQEYEVKLPESERLKTDWEALRDNPHLSELAGEISALELHLPEFRKAEEKAVSLENTAAKLTEQQEQKRRDWENAKNQLAALRAEEDALSDAATNLYRQEQENGKLGQRKTALDKLQAAEQAWQDAVTAFAQEQEVVQTLQKQKEERQLAFHEAAAEADRQQAEIDGLHKLGEQKIEAENAWEAAQTKSGDLKEIEMRLKKCGKLEKSVEKAKRVWITAMQKEDDQLGAYNNLHQIFVREQAGILAKELSVGKPCPVCGSTEHPAPARSTCPVPKQEDLDAAKSGWELARTEAETKRSEKEKKEAALEVERQELLKQAERCMEGADSDRLKEQLKAAMLEAEQKEASCVQTLQEVKKAIEYRESLQNSLERQKEKKKELEESLTAAENQLAEAKKEENERMLEKEKSETALRMLLQEQVPQADIEPEYAAGHIAQMQAALKTERELADTALKQAREAADRYRELDQKLIPEWERKEQTRNGEQQSLQNKLERAQGELHTATEQLLSMRETMKAQNAASCEKRLEALKQEQSDLREAMHHAQKAYENARGDLDKLDGAIRALEESLKDSHEADLPRLEQQCEKLEQDHKEKRDALQEIRTRLEDNENKLRILRIQAENLAALDEKSRWMQDLSKTVNGSGKGQEKFSLETWVQTAYFDRVLEQANQRFRIMSGGQYIFRRHTPDGNLRSNTALDLDVLDYTNGSLRPAASLSGGESFMASLSLALGLSDEIQAEAGGVQMDTMFIDEGFGSLDSEALRQAIHALTGLTGDGRLVGIISHVDSLKEMIERQVVVSKKRDESSKISIRV